MQSHRKGRKTVPLKLTKNYLLLIYNFECFGTANRLYKIQAYTKIIFCVYKVYRQTIKGMHLNSMVSLITLIFTEKSYHNLISKEIHCICTTYYLLMT